MRNQVPSASLRLLRGVWNNDKLIPKINDFKWEQILEEQDLLSGFQKELLARRQKMRRVQDMDDKKGDQMRRRFRGKQCNDHLDFDFLNLDRRHKLQ